MKHCPYCNQELEDSDLFCPNCGKKLTPLKPCGSGGAELNNDDSQQSVDTPEYDEDNSSSKKWWIVAVVAFLLIGGGGYWYWNSKHSNPIASAPVPEAAPDTAAAAPDTAVSDNVEIDSVVSEENDNNRVDERVKNFIRDFYYHIWNDESSSFFRDYLTESCYEKQHQVLIDTNGNEVEDDGEGVARWNFEGLPSGTEANRSSNDITIEAIDREHYRIGIQYEEGGIHYVTLKILEGDSGKLKIDDVKYSY